MKAWTEENTKSVAEKPFDKEIKDGTYGWGISNLNTREGQTGLY